MFYKYPIIGLVFLWLLALPVLGQKTFTWPGNKKAVIVLTYDDALVSQLNTAVPQLNKYKLTGTFFLDGRVSESQFHQWRAVAKNGHELANHSLYHPCAQHKLKVPPRFTLEAYDVPAMLREIGMMNKLLYGIDGKATRTFAYPCSDTQAGGEDYSKPLGSSGLIRFARSGGDKNAIITDYKALNLLQVPSWAIADNTAETELIAFVQAVQKQNGLGVLMFHGTGGDYLKVSATAHEKLLQYLAAHKAEIWVATFQEVMHYIAQQP